MTNTKAEFIKKLIQCPSCKAKINYDIQSPVRPFCSPRCQNADILAWANESYKIPFAPVDSELEESLEASFNLEDPQD